MMKWSKRAVSLATLITYDDRKEEKKFHDWANESDTIKI